jgi:dCMP deaminase
MAMAQLTALRSTCLRRHVGCVLVDRDYFVLATGYNGVAAGVPHCNKLFPVRDDIQFPGEPADVDYVHACPGAKAASGTNLDGCHAIHAEQNALLRCRDPREVYAVFCTASPCMTCVKLLMNTGCQEIYFIEAYPHGDAQALWEASQPTRTWNHWTPELDEALRRHYGDRP